MGGTKLITTFIMSVMRAVMGTEGLDSELPRHVIIVVIEGMKNLLA